MAGDGMAGDCSSGKRKRDGDGMSGNKNRISRNDMAFENLSGVSTEDHIAYDDLTSIYVDTFTSKTIFLQVKPSDTVHEVKVKIRAKEGISLDQQALIFKKMVLDDTNTIGDFDIHNNSTLKLMRKSRGLMHIFVKVPKRTTISLEVKPSDTIGNVKAKLWDKNGIPPEEQALIFNELILEDSGTLVDFDIKKDTTLKLMFKSRGSMKIYIKTLSARRTIISLMVKPTDTIRNVKDSIEFQEHIPRDEQVLIFNEMVLDDTSTLADFQINMESTLTLVLKSKGFMKIYVKRLVGPIQTLEVKPSDTIDNVKAMICEMDGISSCDQRLTFNGNQLDGSYTLSDYHICEESVIYLQYRLRGS